VFERLVQHLRVKLMNPFKLVLITGGSSGIGLALAKLLVSQGADVCLLARDQVKLNQAQESLSSLKTRKNQKIDLISVNISNYGALSLELENWTAAAGLPDLVINSAGVTYPGNFQDLDVGVFHRLMDINYFGTLHIIKILIPAMLKRGSGHIVNISSQAGFVGVFGYSAYSASKYAIRGFSDVLRAELKPSGIKMSIVFPPDTQTPQLDFEAPLKPPETKAIAGNSRILSAESVAASILKGIRKGRYVIIPGFDGKLLYRLTNLMGNLTYPIMDWLIRRAQKNK